MIRRFHEFFESRSWRVFEILPNCAAERAAVHTVAFLTLLWALQRGHYVSSLEQ